jgi:hypothetical protein
LALGDDAIEGLHALEIWLQEETLDELEALASNPPARRRGHTTAAVHDFKRERNGLTYYVFITYRLNAVTRVIHVRTIGLCTATPDGLFL